MFKIKDSTGSVVAGDTQASISALDTAVLTQARLCASVVEAATESKLPARATQKLLQSMTNGMSTLVDSRSEIVAAVREINLIRHKSNLKAAEFGCPDDFWEATGENHNDTITANDKILTD